MHTQVVHTGQALGLLGIFTLLVAGLFLLPALQPVDFQSAYYVRQKMLVAGESAVQLNPGSCEGWNFTEGAQELDLPGSADAGDFTRENAAWFQNSPDNIDAQPLQNGEAWLTCGDFAFSDAIPADAVDIDAMLDLSFAANTYANNEDIVVFAYSIDGGINWISLDSFALLEEQSNARHSGYWTYHIDGIDALTQAKDFMVRVRYIPEPPLDSATAYFDGARLQLTYRREAKTSLRLGEYVQMDATTFFSLDTPQVKIQTEENSSFGFLGVKPLQRNIQSVSLIDPDDKEYHPAVHTTAEKVSGGQQTLVSFDRENFHTPGRYIAVFTLQQDDVVQTIRKAFDWGVVIMNDARSVYQLNDTAQLSLGFLDNNGRTICNADVHIETISPSGVHNDYALTEGIQRSEDCSPDVVSSVADYLASFPLDEVGEYRIRLDASSYAGTYRAQSTLEVVEQTNLQLTRIAPTRLVPKQSYDVFLEFVVGDDYIGTVVEPIPANLKISSVGQGGKQIGDELQWSVVWKKGESASLSYVVKAPEQTPQSFVLGPLRADGFAEFRNNQTYGSSWSEQHAWQLHVDERTNETPIFIPLPSSDDLSLETETQVIQADEEPVMKLKAMHPVETTKQSPVSTVLVKEVKLRTPVGEEIQSDPSEVLTAEGELELRFSEADFGRPGKYEVEIATTALGEDKVLTQTFYWGVVAVNVRQSLAPTNTAQKVHLAVVDDLGRTVCDANIDVTVTDPSGSASVFHTSDATIEKNPDCVDKSVTNEPDYSFFYTGTQEGEYQVDVQATTKDGTRQIQDHFSLADVVPFSVQRTEFPTRIYPPAQYPVQFTVQTSEGFQGIVTEEVPDTFAISAISGDGTVSDPQDGHRIIQWEVDWLAGEEYTLAYTFDAPNVSPFFYQLGPLQFTRRDESIAFTEARLWQIAADATKTWDGDGTTASWSECANWNNDTCPGTSDDIIFDGTSNDNSDWDTSAVATVASISVTSMSGSLTITKTPVTISGNFSHTSSGAVVYAGSASISVGGNYTMTSSGGLTSNTSTLTMTGTSNTFNTDQQHYNVVINPSSTGTITANTNDFTISNALTVQTSDTFSLDSAVFITLSKTTGTVLTLNGILSGSGWVSYASTTNFPTTGTISVNLRMDTTNGNPRLSGRTYGGSVEAYNSGSTARVMYMGSSSGQTVTIDGDLWINAAGTNYQYIYGTTYNPTVNIGGDLLYIGVGSGQEYILTGSGTWTVGGDIDFSNGNLSSSSGNLFVMTGTSNTIVADNRTLRNLSISPSSAGTITMQTSDFSISEVLTVSSNGELVIDSGRTVNLIRTTGTAISLDGTISGSGKVIYKTSELFPTTGVISALLQYYSGSADRTMTARTYQGDVEYYQGGLSSYKLILGSAASQTITINGSFLIYAQSSSATIDGSVWNPDLVIGGDLDREDGPGSFEHITTGSGTWSIGGNLDLRDPGATNIATGHTFVMTGTSGNIWANGATFYDLEIDPSSAGTITINDGVAVDNTLTVAANDEAALQSGSYFDLYNDTGTSLVLNGTISGNAYVYYYTPATFPSTGTMDANVFFYPTTADHTIPGRTFGGSIYIQADCGLSSREVNFGSAGSQTITIDGNLEIEGYSNCSVTVDAATNDPDVNIGGDLDFITGAGAGTETITSGAGTWTVSGSADFTNGTYTIEGTNTLVMDGSGTLTIAGNIYKNLTLSGTVTLSSESHNITGNLNMAGGTVTAGTSTVVMSGTAVTIVGGGNTLYNLTIDALFGGATTLQTSDLTVSGTLDVGSNDQLVIDTGRTLTHSGSTLTLSGIISGAGLLIYTSTTAFPTTGTFSANLRFDATSNNQTMSARTYGGYVELYNNAPFGGTTSVTGGSGSIIVSDNFTLNAANGSDIHFYGSTNNPTVTIGGDIDFTGVGTGTEDLEPGTGAWSVAGSIDFQDGTYSVVSTADLKMTGTAETFSGGGNSLYNFTVDPSSTGTITVQTSDVEITNSLVVSSSDTLSISSGRTVTWSGSSFTLSGSITGAGRLTVATTTTIPTGGTLSSVVRFDAGAGGNMTMPARTYGNDVEVYTNGTSFTSVLVDMGAGTHTISGSLIVTVEDNQVVALTGDNNDPDVSITGDVSYVKLGSSNGQIVTGAGTWSVSGNIDLSDGTTTISTGNILEMDGTSKTLTSATTALQNFDVTGGSISNTDAMDVNGTFDVSAGSFTADANVNMNIAGDFTLASGGLFTGPTGSGTMIFDADVFAYDNNATKQNQGNVQVGTSPDSLNLGTDMTYLSLTIAAGDTLYTNGYEMDINSTFTINGTLDATDDVETDETTINVAGSMIFGGSATFTADQSTVILDGSSTQTITSDGESFYNLSITNSSGSYSGCSTSFTPGIDFADSATVSNNYTITTNNVKVEYNSGSTYTITNINWSASTGNDIIFRNSNLSSGTWLLDVSGTQTAVSYVNVGRSDASSGDQIDASDGTNTDCLNNTNWLFAAGINLSGIAYTNEGTTPLDGSGVNKTVTLKVNGSGSYTDEITDSSGAWSITSVPANSTDIVTVYLDDETEEATTVLVSDGVAKTDIDLYQNTVIVRADTGSISNANLNTGDSGDDDIKYSVSGSAATFDSGFELHIWNGDTYAPAGNITTQAADVHIDNSTLSVGSSFVILGGGWNNDGTFSHTSGYVLFQAGSGTYDIDADGTGSDFFNNVEFNDSGGGAEWNLLTDMDVNGYLTIYGGTFDFNGANTLYVAGNFTNNDTIIESTGNLVLNATSGTQYIDTSEASSLAATNLNNLELNDAGGSATYKTIYPLDINGDVNITGGTFDLSGPTAWYLTSDTSGYGSSWRMKPVDPSGSSNDTTKCDDTGTGQSGYCTFVPGNTSTTWDGSIPSAITNTGWMLNNGQPITGTFAAGTWSVDITTVYTAGSCSYGRRQVNARLWKADADLANPVAISGWKNVNISTGTNDYAIFITGIPEETLTNQVLYVEFAIWLAIPSCGGSSPTQVALRVNEGGTKQKVNSTAFSPELTLAGDWANSDTFTHGNSRVVLDGSSLQTLSGTMTSASSFYDLAIENSSGSYSGCSASFTPGVDFAAAATTAGEYTITTSDVKVEYNSGSTYTMNDINWDGQTYGSEIIFRNSSLGSGTWLLDVSGAQTVKFVNVGRSDASGGDLIDSSHVSNIDCQNTTNWDFDAVQFSISDTSVGFGPLSTSGARYATGDASGTGTKTSAHTISVRTSADDGYALTYYGPLLTSGSDDINAATISNDDDGAPGSEQFGIACTTDGDATIASGYDATSPADYSFVANTTTTIASEAGSTATENFSIYYIANAAGTTPAGSYSTDITYVVTGKF